MNLEIKDIETNKLYFDPRNPRFYGLELQHEMEEDETISEMLEDEGVTDLMESIGSKGYFQGEPLLVVEEEGEYVVVEGNRRLAATKLLNGQIAAPSRKLKTIEQIQNESSQKPDILPCVIYKDRDDVTLYLGYRHVSGVKEWDSLSKAHYVKKLLDEYSAESEDYKERLNQIRRQIGTTTGYLARLMAGLELYLYAKEKVFSKLRLEIRNIEFSLITTSLSYADIKLWLGIKDFYMDIRPQLDPQNVELMFKFLFVVRNDATTIIRESRQLRDFNYIVKSEEAVKVLEETGDIETAGLLTEGPSEAFVKLMERSSKCLEQAWGYIGKGRVKSIFDKEIDMAKEIKAQIQSILGAMENSSKKED